MPNRAQPVQTTKKLSALRQICVAIDHLHDGDYECAITLAAAGEGQLPETPKEYLFKLLRRLKPEGDFNAFITWMKHPSGAGTATIEEFEVAVVIARAIQKFVAVYEESCQPFNEFSDWAVKHGHMPRPIIERAAKS